MVNAICDECKTGKLRQVIGPYHTTYKDASGAIRDLVVDNVTSYKCDNCDNEVLDDAGMQQIDEARRSALGLLSGSDISQFRYELKKTQKQMSALLGIGEKTYCRWETGSFQTEAFDRYLRLLMRNRRVVVWLTEIAEEKSHSSPLPVKETASLFPHLSDKRVSSQKSLAARFAADLLSGRLFAH